MSNFQPFNLVQAFVNKIESPLLGIFSSREYLYKLLESFCNLPDVLPLKITSQLLLSPHLPARHFFICCMVRNQHCLLTRDEERCNYLRKKEERFKRNCFEEVFFLLISTHFCNTDKQCHGLDHTWHKPANLWWGQLLSVELLLFIGFEDVESALQRSVWMLRNAG